MSTTPAAAGASPRPVVFLNLQLVEAPQRVGPVAQTAAEEIGKVTGGTNHAEIARALNHLFDQTNALLVGTVTPPGGVDPRDWLLARGVRGVSAPDWFDQPDPFTRRTAIANWLARHRPPHAIVIDRPGIGPDAAIRIEVRDTATITLEACTRAAAMLARAA